MCKKKIAILSVLKPVDDTRSFEKIGFSISQTNKYEVEIIGFSGKKNHPAQNIHFHPVFNFHRLDWRRLFASWKIHKKLLQIKPDLLIVNTHELLWVTCLHRIIFGTKLLYDIRENYYRNIRYTNTFPAGLKYVLAAYLRLKERFCIRYFIDWNIVAEACYPAEMPFLKQKHTVLENKAIIPEGLHNHPRKVNSSMIFAYTGTIGEHYGIFETVYFFKKIKPYFPGSKLVICGYCAAKKTLDKLTLLIENEGDITLVGGSERVPHPKILTTISEADCVIMPYQPSKSTENRIPTKLFECLILKTPVIITPNPIWDSMLSHYDAGISVDFNSPSLDLIAARFHKPFYTTSHQMDELLWSNEEPKLLDLINRFCPV